MVSAHAPAVIILCHISAVREDASYAPVPDHGRAPLALAKSSSSQVCQGFLLGQGQHLLASNLCNKCSGQIHLGLAFCDQGTTPNLPCWERGPGLQQVGG